MEEPLGPITQTLLNLVSNGSYRENSAKLVWRNLKVTPKRSGNGRGTSATVRPIIADVSGSIQPGTLVALMGPSGAGKSTLMSALAYRLCDTTTVEGDILVDGLPIGPYMYRISGYVYQDELLPASITVREHLQLMAHLKLGRSVSCESKRFLIDSILIRMGLEKCADTRIQRDGQEEKTLSGGEKKRLAFAVELLSQPKVLFCDEPTTGLDSYSARQLVNTMKSLTRSGTSVLCSIHQPSEELFYQFDSVVLLSGGRIAFLGPPKQAVLFFKGQGVDFDNGHNAANLLINALSTSTTRNGMTVAPETICDYYSMSMAAKQQETLIYPNQFNVSRKNAFRDIQDTKPWWGYVLFWLMYRNALQSHRNPNLQYMKLLQRTIIALLVGLCFSDSIEMKQRGIQSMQGIIFLIVSENTFLPMYAVLSIFPESFPLFLRERKANLYSTAQFYISQVVSMIPFVLLETSIFLLVVYFLANLRPTWAALGCTLAASILVMNISIACGCFFSTLFPSVSSAMSYLVPFDYILMITSGIFIKIWTIPKILRWLPFISWMMFASEAITIAQWDGVTKIECSSVVPSVCLRNGQEVLQQYSFSANHLRTDFGVLIAQYFVYHTLGLICLAVRARRS